MLNITVKSSSLYTARPEECYIDPINFNLADFYDDSTCIFDREICFVYRFPFTAVRLRFKVLFFSKIGTD